MAPSEPSLTVLGCDGSYPGPGGAASGYLVRVAGTALLLDAGPGTFANLQRHLHPGALDAVVLSHEHPDHWSDLESLAVWLRLGAPDAAPMPVLAPPGLRARSYFADDPRLAWREVEPSSQLVVAGARLRFVATDHGPPTLAVRVDAVAGARAGDPAQAFAYSADSGPDWTVEELGAGLGTVLCEATYTKADEGSFRHLSGRQAGAMAAAAGVRRLVLTHRWPTVSAEELRAEASEAFGHPVEQAVTDRVVSW